MKKHEVIIYANELIKKHLNTDFTYYYERDKVWTFKFGTGYRRLGLCDYRKKQIRISENFIEYATFEEVKDILLHEIAHALTPGAHHGPRWKQKCIELGARPDRLFRHLEVEEITQ